MPLFKYSQKSIHKIELKIKKIIHTEKIVLLYKN
jgi:hypothetical protein